MNKALAIAGTLLALSSAYLLLWPVAVDPVAWRAPVDRGYVDPFASKQGAKTSHQADIEPRSPPHHEHSRARPLGLRREIPSPVKAANQDAIARFGPGGKQVAYQPLEATWRETEDDVGDGALGSHGRNVCPLRNGHATRIRELGLT